MNIAQGLAHAKKVYGNRQAVVCGDIHYTWIDFETHWHVGWHLLECNGVIRWRY